MDEELFNEFVEAVSKMRRLQSEYFATRSMVVLVDARKAEKRVDALLDELTGEDNLFRENIRP